jgi:hypothetical protein
VAADEVPARRLERYFKSGSGKACFKKSFLGTAEQRPLLQPRCSQANRPRVNSMPIDALSSARFIYDENATPPNIESSIGSSS